MNKHAFDPVALAFGVLFAACGVLVLTGTFGAVVVENARWWPVYLIAVGLLFLVPAVRSRPRAETEQSDEPQPAEAHTGDDAAS